MLVSFINYPILFTSSCPVTAAHLETDAGTVALPSNGPRKGCNEV